MLVPKHLVRLGAIKLHAEPPTITTCEPTFCSRGVASQPLTRVGRVKLCAARAADVSTPKKGWLTLKRAAPIELRPN